MRTVYEEDAENKLGRTAPLNKKALDYDRTYSGCGVRQRTRQFHIRETENCF